ncbi:EXS-domain-containing protein, partial [Atractiella rhizophila]
HLVNAGKYGCGIFQQFCYFNWRIHGSPSPSESYMMPLWIAVSIVNSVYTYSWDVKMDWSLFQSHAKYLFLRKDLAYREYWVR